MAKATKKSRTKPAARKPSTKKAKAPAKPKARLKAKPKAPAAAKPPAAPPAATAADKPAPAAAPVPAPAPAPAPAPKPAPEVAAGGVPGLPLKPKEEAAPLGKEDAAKLDEILARYGRDPVYILSMLQDIQDVRNYVPRAFIEGIARELGIPRTRIYRIATFFKALSLTPRGRHICTVCVGTTCHVRGAPKLIDKVERDLSIKAGETTRDMAVTLETVGCVGACALGPLVVLDGKYHGHMTTEKLGKLLKTL
jgi:NADH-quinone oxidoreductase subunit E